MGGAVGGARPLGKGSPPPLSAEQFYRQQKLLRKLYVPFVQSVDVMVQCVFDGAV